MKHPAARVFSLALLGALSMGAQTQTSTPANPTQAVPRTTGSVQGVVKDNSGGIIPGAPVTITDNAGHTRQGTTKSDGSYTFRGLAPGAYNVGASYTGLQQASPLAVNVVAGQTANGNIVLQVGEQKQELTVTDSVANEVSTDPSSNASGLVLQKADLDALPDDPDDLQADLEALAGPSAGPGGSQIYVDGFTGGQLPPKNTIREIRINSNPFSAEFDKLGYGRIQIFTKPGTDKFHGQGYYDISDGLWNSRNPFLAEAPPFRTQQFGGNVSGPINKAASFFIDFERRNIDDNGIITATIPTPDFLGSQIYQSYYPTPQRRTSFSPRVDYQLGANNTLSFRYRLVENDHLLTHIGSFDIPQLTVGNQTYGSNGDTQSMRDQSFQAVDTAVLNTHLVNETHFEYERSASSITSVTTGPQLNVGQAFVAGGSGYSAPGYPNTTSLENYYELQNYSTATVGAHTIKFGVRVRGDQLNDVSPLNFNGEYTFQGGSNGQSSLQQYLTTVQMLNAGMSSQAITAAGFGPSQFLIERGNPAINFYQLDFGPFVQDDWRARPNLTLSFGLRWEDQTNINDKNDWAPRFGLAWSPGSRGGNSRPKTVFRAGWGYFYERFGASNVENAYRSNMVQQYTVDHPTGYDATFATIPSLSQLTITNAQQQYVIDQNLKAPRLMETVVGMDRQLAAHTQLSVNFVNSRGTHLLLTDNINAPIPIVGQLPPGATATIVGGNSGIAVNDLGTRPYGDVGDIYDYQSVGILKQTQVMVNVNSQLGRWLTLFTRYSYTQAHSDTDGLGSMPSNPYNIAQDWGRSSMDIHHTFFMGGSMTAKWGLRLSPFMVVRSGTPFNITTGTDLYLQGQGAPTSRPEAICDLSTTALTPACFNPLPVVGAPLIERNYGTSPGFLGLNLRLSKTFGFGTTKFAGPSGGARAGGGGGHFGGGGFRGFGESTEHRYNLTLSVNARNILNHENLNTPNGSLTSLFFLKSTNIAGGFGPESTVSDQRRIDLQLRFAF